LENLRVLSRGNRDAARRGNSARKLVGKAGQVFYHTIHQAVGIFGHITIHIGMPVTDRPSCLVAARGRAMLILGQKCSLMKGCASKYTTFSSSWCAIYGNWQANESGALIVAGVIAINK
jgi:hypothetical protein